MFLACSLSYVVCLFFFFKQKTAYEMRISDWSSDVCSSDLMFPQQPVILATAPTWFRDKNKGRREAFADNPSNMEACFRAHRVRHWQDDNHPQGYQIGRAACRERVCQYV